MQNIIGNITKRLLWGSILVMLIGLLSTGCGGGGSTDKPTGSGAPNVSDNAENHQENEDTGTDGATDDNQSDNNADTVSAEQAEKFVVVNSNFNVLF